MSGWRKIPLGSVAAVVPGFAFKSKDWCQKGVPVLKIKNIVGDGSVETTAADCVPVEFNTERMSRYRIGHGDILIAMTGATAGKVGMIRSHGSYLLNQRVAKLVPKDVDPGFFWSVVSSSEYEQLFFRLADGAAQPNMSGSQIEGLPIPLPPLETQRRIAAILGAYDDLIEVNRRRVAVLEEMARGHFEEWFVRFRFPGHEDVPIVDAPDGPLPDGWSWGPLKEVLALRSGFAFKSSTFDEAGQYSLITIKHVHDGLLRPPFESKIVEPPRNMPEHCKIIAGDILVSLTGNVGRTCLAWGQDLLLNQRVAKAEPSEKHFRSFAYCWFRSSNTLQRLQNIANGAAQQNLSPVQTVGLTIPIPPGKLAAQFEHLVHPVLESIVLAHRSIAVLQDQRDLLLPRLVSGQLSVEAAERELMDAA